jgi:transposase
MLKKYHVRLSADERTLLTDLITAGTAAARTQTHARILLKADAGPDGPAWIDADIATALEVGVRTIERVRERWVLDGLEAALHPRPVTTPRRRKLDGEQEAHLIALACSTPPAGRKRWSLRLLADRLVELEVVDGIAPETVRTMLKKTSSSPG